MVLEAALFIPVLLLFIVGMVQIGKTTYIYYTLKKTIYTAAEYLANQQGVDMCNLQGSTSAQAAINYALSGTTDGSADSFLPALTADMVAVTAECYDANTGTVGECQSTGCDSAAGGTRPDFLVVSIPNGYQVTPRIPYMQLDPIQLMPQVRVPFGGTVQ